MTEEKKSKHWMLVAHNLQHLAKVHEGDRTWWCAPSQCKYGDRAFVYKPQHGIVLYLQLGTHAPSQEFCEHFRLITTNVQVVEVFDPPIPVKSLRLGTNLKSETFLRRQFQGTSFQFISHESVAEILQIHII